LWFGRRTSTNGRSLTRFNIVILMSCGELLANSRKVGKGVFVTMLNMVIGPSRIAPSVLDRMAVPAPAITDPDFLQVFGECLRQLRMILGSQDGASFIIPGTGTMGMEMVTASFLPAGVPVALVSTGYWGDRWAAICARLGMDLHTVRCAPGTGPDLERVESVIRDKGCQALIVTHADSSTGVLADLQALAAIARDHGALTLVDGICGAGIEAVEQTRWGIDVYLTGTPKGLGVPAGLALISANERAMSLLKGRSWECPSFSLDLKPWIPVFAAAEEGLPGYFQSPAGNLVLALAEGLRLVLMEGLEARVQRHRELTRMLHAGLAANGIQLLVPDEGGRANGVTVCLYPDAWGSELLEAVKRFRVLLVSGLYPGMETRTFRIGHLGNVTQSDIEMTLGAISQALAEVPRRTVSRLNR
jgi:alanine-glyoxylate transaminase / serine-glyoxylate transaminase / serine-pyruvate transaminase